MSKEEHVRYAIAARRRQELFETRVRATAAEHLERYENTLRALESEGLLQYIPQEARQAQELIGQARRMLATDPAAARTVSMEAGRQMYGLRTYAHEAFRAARQAELEAETHRKVREQAARVGFEQQWQSELSAWADSLARRLAAAPLAELRRSLLQRDTAVTEQELATALQAIRRNADKQAVAVREEGRRKAEDETRQQLLVELARESEAKGTGLEERSVEDLSRLVREQVERADNRAVDEDARREVVRSVSAALRDAGFVVETPRRVAAGGKDEVLIRASRPAGAEATFRVNLEGGMRYEFDGYEGVACRQDMNQVLPELQSVYGIQLSDHRVIWENPDDEDRDARPQPDSQQRSGHE